MTLTAAPPVTALELDIVICTTGDHHLLRELGCPGTFYQHEATSAQPELLGYQCHRVLQESLGRYDYYCYLEDDIVLHDPLFFAKLNTFNLGCGAFADPKPLLQPLRYELTINASPDKRGMLEKLYVDHSSDPLPPQEPSSFSVEMFGLTATLRRTVYPHAGCFFLSHHQLEYLVRQPVFHDRSTLYVTPLDTAATYAIGTTFPVFKPEPSSGGFFEVCHAHPNLLEQLEPGVGSVPRWRPVR